MATEVYEHLIASIFEAQCIWTRCNSKLALRATPSKKASRVEVDVMAFRTTEPKELLVIECKSTLGSQGLDWKTFAGTNPNRSHRYSIFFDREKRDRVETAIRETYQIFRPIPVIFCLASAATQQRDYKKISRYLRQNEMRLLGQSWVRNQLRLIAKNTAYQNNPAALAAAMLFHPNRGRYA